MNNNTQKIKVGCCGFPTARKKYFENLSVIEVQATFYDFVNPAILEKWRTEAPKDFEFTLKAFQFITHPSNSPTYRRVKRSTKVDFSKLGNFKPNKEVFDCYKILVEYAEILKAKIIIFQSPPSFKPEKENIQNMNKFFSKIDRKDLIFGWEARGTWEPKEIKNICKELDLIDVVDPFLRNSTYGKILYYRLHGGKDYSHTFTDEELETLVEKLINKKGFIMFNNINMFNDALRFKNILHKHFQSR